MKLIQIQLVVKLAVAKTCILCPPLGDYDGTCPKSASPGFDSRRTHSLFRVLLSIFLQKYGKTSDMS